MKWRHVIATVGVIASAVAIMSSLWSRGAAYQGKPLRHWLTCLNSGNQAAEAEGANALRQMGTNALPELVSIATRRDSPLRPALVRMVGEGLASKLGLPNRDGQRARSVTAFWILNKTAAPAAQELINSINKGRNVATAAEALLGIGPDAICWWTNAVTLADPLVRLEVVRVLVDYPSDFNLRNREALEDSAQFRSAAPIAVAILIKFAEDKDPKIRSLAADGLGYFRADLEHSVPVLTKLLNDSDLGPRSGAVQALGSFGPQAKSAVPDLLSYIRRAPTASERVAGIIALWHVNPGAAADAGFTIQVQPP